MTIFFTNVNTHGKCCFRDFLFATLFSRLFIYIVLSLRQRILAHRGLRRRHNPSDIDAVLQAVETELSGSDRIVTTMATTNLNLSASAFTAVLTDTASVYFGKRWEQRKITRVSQQNIF